MARSAFIRIVCITWYYFLIGGSWKAPAEETRREWKGYTSRQAGFSVRYPPNWRILPPPGPSLDIVSFPLSKRETGSIIPLGGARIGLLSRPDYIGDLEYWIRFNGRGNETVSRAVVILHRASSGSELRTTEVVSDWGDGKKRYENVDCYFEISLHLFYSRLTYWKGDSGEQGYRDAQHGVVETVVLRGNQKG